MILLKQILSQICPYTVYKIYNKPILIYCLFSPDLKDAYFHIQIAPHNRPFLRFAFEGVSYQYTVLPFGLSLAPRTFTKCMDAALSPLRQMGIRILNYLDDWLVLTLSEVELLYHRSLLLSHLECLGLRVNLAKSALSPSQRISLLGTVFKSVQMRDAVTPESAPSIQRLVTSLATGASRPLKLFQRMLDLMGSTSPVLQLSLLPMRPLQRWLKPRVPSNAWRYRHLRIRVNQASEPLEISSVDGTGRTLGNGLQKEGSLDRCFQHGLKEEGNLHINCQVMLAVCRALHAFLSRPHLHSSRTPLGIGTAQPAFAQSNACARPPSTLKVYVAAIAASQAPKAGQSVGRNNLVVCFLQEVLPRRGRGLAECPSQKYV